MCSSIGAAVAATATLFIEYILIISYFSELLIIDIFCNFCTIIVRWAALAVVVLSESGDICLTGIISC